MGFKYNIFIIYLLFIHFNAIFTDNILINNKSKIIYFDLDIKDDIVIKDIYLKKYNEYFNLAIDTLGFISGLFISKELRYDFILGDTFSPENSYRIFEGKKGEINLYETNDVINFNFVIFKKYKNYNFYDKNRTYDGVLGLALNYTSDILLDECYFFGEDKKYSIMNYLIKELHLIDKNIFTIYKNKFILGDIYQNIHENDIKYCKTKDKIEDSFIYFFWNCDIINIYLDQKEYVNNKSNIKISLLIDSLLKNYIISTSVKVADIIINQINSELNSFNICNINNNKIYCLNEYYNLISDKNIKIKSDNETIIEIPFEILIINKTEKYFNLNIEISEFNIDKHQNILKCGKKLFELYFVVFDKEKRRIGFKKLRINDELNLDIKYHYTNIFPYKNKNNLNQDKITIINLLCFILILLCFIGIIVLLFGKNNYYYY